MVWIQRPDDTEQQRAVKLPDMDERIVWSEDGTARTTEHDAEIAIDAGLAEPNEPDEPDGDSDDDEEDAARSIEERAAEAVTGGEAQADAESTSDVPDENEGDDEHR